MFELLFYVCDFIQSKQERVDKGIETDGSNLSGVSAKCAWDDLSRPPEDEDDSRSICIGSQPRRLSEKGEPFLIEGSYIKLYTYCIICSCIFMGFFLRLMRCLFGFG